ncbi:CHAP domain-containing protein [Candidatus Saccharibacteria bacterium]|nr:CHAP domain-containing protein [Candidatus Saccharibacteria bacterium]
MLSSVVSATGRNTVFDPRTNTAVVSSPRIYDDVNVVTAGGYALLAQTKHLTITTGSVLYGVCLQINTATTATGRTVAHATIFTAKSSWSAVQSGVGWVHSAVIYTVRAPGNVMSSLTNKDTVHAIIQPSSTAQADVPTIDAETSSAVLDRLQAEQRSQIARLLDEQLAANRSLVGSVVAGDPSRGGYPAGWDNARQDSMLDSWGMYNRECVSYAAWKVFQTYGYMPYWGGVGNANQWVRNARNTGIQTSSTPKVHSVAISMRGYYGHAMWVEAVKGDMIYISQYNWDLRGHYSEMWVSSANLTYIYFN